MRVLVAPDKFRDALDAAGAAAALAAGVRDAVPGATVDCCPLGDGGEGTGPVLARACGASEIRTDVTDALGRPCTARWWRAPGDLAIVEMAEAAGLWRLAESERDPLRTSTQGVGELLRVSAEAGCTRVWLCVGGSATVDGGAGCVQALGWRFYDRLGRLMAGPLCGGRLAEIGGIEPPGGVPPLDMTILCDVRNSLLGPRGAAHVYGPQKGASPAAVALLERGLERWSDVIGASAGRDVRELPGIGAAGGLPAALVALTGARLAAGAAFVAEQVGLAGRMAGCTVCLTGEGRIDRQTAEGKVVAEVAATAGRCGVPVTALVGAAVPEDERGRAELAGALGLAEICIITPRGASRAEALRACAANLRRCAAECVAAFARR